jgi:hypothetical protein
MYPYPSRSKSSLGNLYPACEGVRTSAIGERLTWFARYERPYWTVFERRHGIDPSVEAKLSSVL